MKIKKKKKVILLDNFEEEYFKELKKKEPKLHELGLFLIGKMNRTNRDFKLIIYLLISVILPIYTFMFKYIIEK